ncbi:hypothetical protein [Shewanella sp. SR44-3]|uniref:hypothetical protein n=1 Tax=unclassified Shewanella TaxID=196818 RepID=UPI0015F8D400|nr:hypothetical protein [Shewanella sp. SR44-3]MBB1268559.1 hypothetical protein [Shewanella sp. SR44-3]
MFDQIKIQLSTIDWTAVSTVISFFMLILTAFMLMGLYQGSKNIRESTLSRDADILRWAMSDMDLLKPKIRVLTDAHKKQPYCDCADAHLLEYAVQWTDDELAAAQEVSVKLQRIGYMALHNLISRNHFMNIWGPMYLSTWYALEPWVKHKRLDLEEPMTLAEGAYSRIYLEQFALFCESNMPLVLVNNERKRFNLPLLEIKKTNGITRFINKKLHQKERLDI